MIDREYSAHKHTIGMLHKQTINQTVYTGLQLAARELNEALP